MPNLSEILEIMRKPIEYATREQFAHFKKVQALDSFLSGQIETALLSTKSILQRVDLQKLQTLLKNYQQFSEQDQKQTLLRAKAVLEGLILEIAGTPESGSPPKSHAAPREDILQHRESTHRAADSQAVHAAPSFDWSAQVQYVKGVGPQRAKLLEKIDIRTVEDALYFLPRRYEDRGNLKPISSLVPREVQTVSGEVAAV